METREFPWGAEETVDHRGKGSPRGTWAHVALTDEACPGAGESDADVIPVEGEALCTHPGSAPLQACDTTLDGVHGFAGGQRGLWSLVWSLCLHTELG